MQRRTFLKSASAAATLLSANSGFARVLKVEPPIPKLDAHIHLFDPTRTAGIPWPTPADKLLYRPALPGRYEPIARQFQIHGAIAIEASPWPSDNDWLLDLIANHPFIVGMVGNLDLASKDFSTQLSRLAQNPLFLGIRYGNLWGRDLKADLSKDGFIAALKALAITGRVFESANPDLRLLEALNQISDKVPDLRIVADHLPNAHYSPAEEKLYWQQITDLSTKKNVFAKISEIPVLQNGTLVSDPAFYRNRVEGLWQSFGDDRVLFGSDWPNSDTTASFFDTLKIVESITQTKSRQTQQKYYASNSLKAYRWQCRSLDQQQLFPA